MLGIFWPGLSVFHVLAPSGYDRSLTVTRTGLLEAGFAELQLALYSFNCYGTILLYYYITYMTVVL